MPIGVSVARGEMLTIPDNVAYNTARTRIRKAVAKAGRVIIGGGTHKGLFVLRPSSIDDYRRVLDL